ncbi:UNVERIFIED_CONTAM: hypothetical protein GTU68_052552 [Idotea baltica]|nr:hypothetical protein [Idotea baltica]
MQHGGLFNNQEAQDLVDSIGEELLLASNIDESPYRFEFHLLADPDTVNAFALPGGQVFITLALFKELETHGQLAGVLGHEIGHVLERHSAQRIAKQKLTQGITGAAVLATYDPSSGTSNAQIAQMIGGLVNMKYGREDELESDDWGVQLATEAKYDPYAMIEVMNILERASGGAKQAEFFSTHPNPENRREKIKLAIEKHYPDGLPQGLRK